MHCRNIAFLLITGTLCSSCSSAMYFCGPKETISFEVRDRFESLVPGFDGTLQKPTSCDMDEQGFTYVLDEGANQIVVLSPELVVVRVIHGSDEASGLKFPPTFGNRNLLRVGGGVLVLADMERYVQVLDTDGVLLNTFEPEPSPYDLEVSPEGLIVTATSDCKHPVVIYNSDGEALLRHGPSFIQASDEVLDEYWLHGLMRPRLALLPDRRIALFSSHWLRFRIFDDQGSYNDHPIKVMKLLRPEDTDEIPDFLETSTEIEERSPERINASIRAGSLNHDAIPSSHLALGFFSYGDQLCLFSGMRFVQCDDRGRVRCLIDCDQHVNGEIAIRDRRIVICDYLGGTLAIGLLPE